MLNPYTPQETPLVTLEPLVALSSDERPLTLYERIAQGNLLVEAETAARQYWES
jgi:hypothetical protein